MKAVVLAAVEQEKVLLDTGPRMFGQAPIAYMIVFTLSIFIVGLPFLIPWWLKCKGQRLIVTNRKTTYQEGILSKSTSDIRHSDVQHIVVVQSFWQRMFNVGTVAISGAGKSDLEIAIVGIADPQKVRSLIDGLRPR